MSSNSSKLFQEARRHIAGGVNSAVRAFKGVGGEPVFSPAARAPIYGTWTAKIHRLCRFLGPGHPRSRPSGRAQGGDEDAVRNGLSFGAPTAIETEMAQRIKSFMPSIEKLRMVSSGTEATMSAIRLARGYTGRDKIIKFEGCYHGSGDSLLVKAGSSALTLGVPSSPGVPKALAELTLTLEYNHLEPVHAAFKTHGQEIACVIVEPVAGNMNCVPPLPGFLAGLRALCTEHGALLIFDEVMTGFRVGLGGAQALYGVKPDLTTLGKVIGGGLPVGAFGGRADIMDRLTPDGPIFHAGTLSGNPVAMACGLATLKEIAQPGFYEALTAKSKKLMDGLKQRASAAGVPLSTHAVGGMFGFFFSSEPTISRFAQVTACDIERFKKFFHGMLRAGVYLAPSAYEAGFVSSAHTDADLATTLEAAEHAFKILQGT